MTESRDLPVFWSGRPSPGSVTAPPAVAAVAGGRPAVPVWVNEAGGLTFEVGDGAERCFVKWAPAGSDELDLAAEADRMEWACRFHPVPRGRAPRRRPPQGGGRRAGSRGVAPEPSGAHGRLGSRPRTFWMNKNRNGRGRRAFRNASADGRR
jgi:hypothetical protein